MNKILLLPRYDRTGASSRYRFYNFISYLEKKGIECEVSSLLDSTYLSNKYNNKPWVLSAILCYIKRIKVLLQLDEYDLLFIEKELFPFFPSWLESILRPKNIPYVVDYDDAIFHRYDQSSSRITRFLLGNKIKNIISGSRKVISGNSYLDEYAKLAGSLDHVILPTVVDTDYYDSVHVKKNEQFTIVWIGSPSTANYIMGIADALKTVHELLSVKFIMIGGKVDIPGLPIQYVEWSSENEVQILKTAHVGIMPLPDKEWERGKCGFKLIQYMASKLSVVASPVGVNVDIVNHGNNGYLASSPDEWVKYLCQVHDDANLDMGLNGHADVLAKYNQKKIAKSLCDILISSCEVKNVDIDVINGFGAEWSSFDNSELHSGELEKIWQDYFNIFPWEVLPEGGGIGADIGCGSGRWAEFVLPNVKMLHLVDPSVVAIGVAQNKLSTFDNANFHITDTSNLPFKDGSLDFAYSLGVLHHIPDIQSAFNNISIKLKQGAPFLVYLYYALDNKPKWFKLLWLLSNMIRIIISKLPYKGRYFISQIIAIMFYWPVCSVGSFLHTLNIKPSNWPLSYYIGKPLYVMRNDALDRFGTSLETRFSKAEIQQLYETNGFSNIKFSDFEPFWCACGIKK